MYIRNLGYPLLQIGGPQSFFGPFRNSKATLTAYIFGMKQRCALSGSALETTMGFLTSFQFQNVKNFGPQTA